MFSELSSVQKAAFFMAFMFMAALLIFSKAFIPYNDYKRLLENYSIETTGTIITTDPPERDELFYYGPIVEYLNEYQVRIRCEAVSPVKSSMDFREGQRVRIRHDGAMGSEVVILDDTTCPDRFMFLSISAAVIAAIGLIDFIVHAVIAFKQNSGKTKYRKAPNGMTFKEWQEMQRLLETAETAAPPADGDDHAD